jgi:hypothetical protein
VLEGLTPKRFIAMGESQSAGRMTTYVNAIHPLAKVYSAFWIHSRGGGGAPLTAGSGGGLASLLAGTPTTTIRDDLSEPVMQFQTETDVVQFYQARQPDSDHLRTWEVAGTAHADQRFAANQTASLGCTDVNNGPQHFVDKAGIHGLNHWLVDGTPPPTGTLLQLNSANSGYVLDANGNAEGGIRTPYVDVPVARYSGVETQGGGFICNLFGETVPFTPDQLATLYPNHQDYVAKVTASAASAQQAGFLLAQEAATMVSDATAAPVPK